MNPARGYILSIELTEWTDRNRDGRVTTAFDELPVLRRHRRLILVILDNHRVRTPGVGGEEGWRWKSPATAAGLADRVWSIREWPTYPARPCVPV